MGYLDEYKKAKKAGEVKNLIPSFVDLRTKGEQIIGQYIAASTMKGKLADVPYKQYLFKTDTGLIKFSMGAATDAEVFPSMVPGEVYAITCEGQEDLEGGKKINRFTVEFLPGLGSPITVNPDDIPF